MRTDALIMPAVTLLLVAAILLDIPIFRNVIVFSYLSFIPGLVILVAFGLRELSLLKTVLLSIALSLAASMFIGLLVNELYLILGFSKPLSVIPLTAAMSAFTLVVFFISCRHGFSIDSAPLCRVFEAAKGHFPLTLVLLSLPSLGIVGAVYRNTPIMIVLCLAIVLLSVLSIASNKLIPSEYYPLLIFSISISIVLLSLMMSKYTIGDDANIEYYVFRITQIRGYWGSIDLLTNFAMSLNFNSVLSITVLPDFYSVLMNLDDQRLFAILYSFIFSLVPVTLYEIYRSETNKLIGLLSTLFFVFSANAFFGEPISVNRQIIGTLFLVLSILVWLDRALPTIKKRILLVVLGLSIALSHYSLAVIYVIVVSSIVIYSSVKRSREGTRFDDIFDGPTVLTIFGGTFLWEAFSPGSTLFEIVGSARRAILELVGYSGAAAGVTGTIYALPQVFTAASWINLVTMGLVTLSLVVGAIAVILFSRRVEISDKYKWIILLSALLFAVSFLFPSIASTINFTRLYGISLLFLSPCFTLGALFLLGIIQSVLRIGKKTQRNSILQNKHGKTALLLVSVLLCAYFLSQVGFVNHATKGVIRSPTFSFDYYRMETSSDPPVQIVFSWAYIQEEEVFSAIWLSKYSSGWSFVYADSASRMHVLASVGLISQGLIKPLINATESGRGQFLYLNRLNAARGITPTSIGYNSTYDISSSLDKSDSIYSNGNSEIWIRSVVP